MIPGLRTGDDAVIGVRGPRRLGRCSRCRRPVVKVKAQANRQGRPRELEAAPIELSIWDRAGERGLIAVGRSTVRDLPLAERRWSDETVYRAHRCNGGHPIDPGADDPFEEDDEPIDPGAERGPSDAAGSLLGS